MANWLYQAEEFRLLQGQISELEERLEVMKERQSASRAAMQGMMGDYMHADYCGVMVTRMCR
jgi:hypothetical protein